MNFEIRVGLFQRWGEDGVKQKVQNCINKIKATEAEPYLDGNFP